MVKMLATSINPWCQIPNGSRWVISQDVANPKKHVVNITSKKAITNHSNASIARNFEFMNQVLSQQQGKCKYTFEDFIALKNFQRIAENKYNSYCKAHNIFARILELFLGIFRGYSYRTSYKRLNQTIEKHLAAIDKTPVAVFKKWWTEGFCEHVKPGPVFIHVSAHFEDKIFTFDAAHMLSKENPKQQYFDLLKSVQDKIASFRPGKNPVIEAEQISFSKVASENKKEKKEKEDLHLQGVICKDDGSIQKSLPGVALLIYEGWANKVLKQSSALSQYKILDKDENFILGKKPQTNFNVEMERRLEKLICKNRLEVLSTPTSLLREKIRKQVVDTIAVLSKSMSAGCKSRKSCQVFSVVSILINEEVFPLVKMSYINENREEGWDDDMYVNIRYEADQNFAEIEEQADEDSKIIFDQWVVTRMEKDKFRITENNVFDLVLNTHSSPKRHDSKENLGKILGRDLWEMFPETIADKNDNFINDSRK